MCAMRQSVVMGKVHNPAYVLQALRFRYKEKYVIGACDLMTQDPMSDLSDKQFFCMVVCRTPIKFDKVKKSRYHIPLSSSRHVTRR